MINNIYKIPVELAKIFLSMEITTCFCYMENYSTYDNSDVVPFTFFFLDKFGDDEYYGFDIKKSELMSLETYAKEIERVRKEIFVSPNRYVIEKIRDVSEEVAYSLDVTAELENAKYIDTLLESLIEKIKACC